MTLYNFTGGNDGSIPQAGVILDNSGNLYGATKFGGAGAGTLFQFSPTSGVLTPLHNFSGSPEGGLIRDSSGNFYGTTAGGGTENQGTVFELSSDGTTFTTLHNFTGTDGATPEDSLVMDSQGNLFGTTFGGGGTGAAGTVFELSPDGNGGYNFTTLHAFTGGSDGKNLISGLLLDSQGNLYGTTTQGGDFGNGTVFKISPDGTFTTLHSFAGGSDGKAPVGGLIMDSNGNIYGTSYGVTFGSGSDGFGTVFKISSDGTFTTLYNFTGGSDGAYPEGTLLMDSQGNLYGTAFGQLSGSSGTVFELSPDGNGGFDFTSLHTFTGSDGANPYAGLIADSNGNLYGTTFAGGSKGDGTIFELTGALPPTVTSSTADLPVNATSLTINGEAFDSNAANDSVILDNGVTGTVTSATATSLTVSLSGLSGLTAGTALHASVTVNGVSSGSTVQVATVAPVLTPSTDNLPVNATNLTINGGGFDSNAAHDSVTFSNGVTGTVTSATATSLTVSLNGFSSVTAGTALQASVSVNGVSNGNAVTVATIAPVITSSMEQEPTSIAISTIQNTYGFLAQFETITARVTGPGGIPINEGVVTFQVNGETLVAPVHDGFATVTFVTPLLSLDLTIMLDELFAHPLNAVYSDSGGNYGLAPTFVPVPAMLIDMFFFLLNQENQQMAQS